MAQLSIHDDERRTRSTPTRLRVVPPEGQPTAGGTGGGWLWYCIPLLLLLTGPAVLVLVAFEVPSWARAVPALTYIAVVPGLAWMRLLRLADRGTEVLLAIGLSLAIGVLVAQLMIYLHVWSSTLGLAALVVIASLPGLVELYLGPRPGRPATITAHGDEPS